MSILREGNSHKKQTAEINGQENIARQHTPGYPPPFQQHREDPHQRRRRNGRGRNILRTRKRIFEDTQTRTNTSVEGSARSPSCISEVSSSPTLFFSAQPSRKASYL